MKILPTLRFRFLPFLRGVGVLALLLGGAPALRSAPTFTALSPWVSEATGQALAREAILPEGADPGATIATVLYLQNLAAPRVGRDSDAAIIESFLAEGMLVVTVDFAEHPRARVPFLNQDIVKLRRDIAADQGAGAATRFPTGYAMDNNHLFIVPEGCRLLRDLEYVVTGGAVQGMDIIYPANPLIPVGSLIEFSFDNNNRMNSSNLGNFDDSLLSAQASEGFATAMADHPVVGGYSGIDPMPHSALAIRAAVRAVRAQSVELKLNGRIATMGFSRGSGVALMAATTKDVEEWTVYFSSTGTFTQAEEDWVSVVPDVDPFVQGAIILSGRFSYIELLEDDPQLGRYEGAWGPLETSFDRWKSMGAIDYLESDPGFSFFLSLNENEDKHANHHMDVLKSRLDALGADYVYYPDTRDLPNPHRVPLDPEILQALNRYMRETLMDPNPYAAVTGLELASEVVDGSVSYVTSIALPPADYALEVSSELGTWELRQTVRPDGDGVVRFDVTDAADGPRFVRLGPPLDPLKDETE